MQMEKVEVTGATVDFFKFIQNGVVCYQFDSSKLGPPEPMVNAMAGLQLLKEGEELHMINHTAPSVLFSRVDAEFSHKVEELGDGKIKIIFSKIPGSVSSTDFTNTKCGGGC